MDAWLREHPEDAARVQLWAADRDALRARFNPVLDEPLTEALRSAVMDDGPAARQSGPLPARLRRPWARAAVVAALLVAGAMVGGSLVWQLKPGADLAQAGRGSWTQRAAVAHRVYVPEVRHPVEVAVAGAPAAERRAQEEHLARWLTKRLDMPVQLFDLRSQDFELVGGRLLPDANGPSAQLMYQNSAGQRVTFYLSRSEPGVATAFRFHREGEVSMFYWIEEGYACALVGTLPRERLLALAEAAYRQAEAAEHSPAPARIPKPAS